MASNKKASASKNTASKNTASKKKKRKKSNLRKNILRLFKWYNGLITDTERKEIKRVPHLFGRKVSFAGFMLLVMLLIVLLVLLLNDRSVGVDNQTLVVTGLPDDFEGFKILHISDLNAASLGQDQSQLMRVIENLSYNIVVFTGDMVGSSGNAEPFYTLLEQLGTKKPMYFIAGDNDPAPTLSEPRDNSSETLTLRQMVLSDWVLGAEERGATYVDMPIEYTKGSSTLWLMPDYLLNLNVAQYADEFKDEMEQETESMLEGVAASRNTLPNTNYRYNIIKKSANLVTSIGEDDLMIMLSHEVPTDSQINTSQRALTGDDYKYYFSAPDVILSGHYCGGEWRLPLLGAFYAGSDILERDGWFPDNGYVSGQRRVGSAIVYTTTGLGNNGDTVFAGRLFNPPQVSLLTLTGELPTSFLD